MTTVLVTGTTGFLGGHVAAALLAAGHDVRAAVRSRAHLTALDGAIRAIVGPEASPLRFVEADLTRDDGWDDAVGGCEFVVHVASPLPSSMPQDETELIVPARDGTLRVLGASKRAGVRRVVLTSSLAAIVHGSGDPPYTEEQWTNVESARCNAYHKSKTLAERAAWELAQREAIELVALNPGFMLGPVLRATCGTSVDVIAKLLRGAYPGIPRLGFSTVDVRDVAVAHVRALTAAAAGQRILLGGPTLWFREIADILRAQYPTRAIVRRNLPDWVMRFVALFDPSTRAVLGNLSHEERVCTDKAQRLLDWNPRPLRQTVLDTAESLMRFGLA